MIVQLILTNDTENYNVSTSLQYYWSEVIYTCIMVCGRNLGVYRKAHKNEYAKKQLYDLEGESQNQDLITKQDGF